MMAVAETLLPFLREPKVSTSFRRFPQNFASGTNGHNGTVTLVSAWYQQGKGVSTLIGNTSDWALISYGCKDVLPIQLPQPAAIFSSPVAMSWLDQIADSNAISSTILSVIHPHLYAVGMKALDHLQDSPQIQRQDVLQGWNSIFSGISVIFNGTIAGHQDTQSRHHWYDLLITLGCYQNCKLELPGAGLSLDYHPGTVVGISGMMLEHQVSEFDGDRVAYAHFMRNNVHEWAGIPGGDWMKTEYYE